MGADGNCGLNSHATPHTSSAGVIRSRPSIFLFVKQMPIPVDYLSVQT